MWRLWVVFVLLCSIFVVISIRLFYWQIIAGNSLRIQATNQYAVEHLLPATRGQILDSDQTPIVLSQPAFLVFAEPKNIQDPLSVSRKLAEIFALDQKTLFRELSDINRMWVPIAHKVEGKMYENISALKLKGIGFEKESKRYYPESSMAAHLLGFVGSDENGNDKGYFGIEGYYDRELRGKDGIVQSEKDVKGAPIIIGDTKRINAEKGRSLTLWLDRAVQKIIDTRLKEGIEKYGAKEGTVVVMDPKTGGILGMSSYPSYDPTTYTEFDKALYKNPVVAGNFEPGSTFKVFVMASGIQEKLITPTTIIDEKGPVQVSDYTIRTWNNEYHGTISMSDVLRFSSNVGMVYVANKLGKDTLLRYIRHFGFGDITGVDLEEEQSSELRVDRDWSDIDVATASFGQGIAVTPLQMVRAVGALANDGWLMEPHVVKEMIDSKGKHIEIKPKKIRQVVSSGTAKILTEMMVTAVDKGEAQWAKPKGYRVAGKTGTAQIPVAGHYDDKKTIASFVGFAPADNPRFVMLVTLREPTSSPWGSETAAPLFLTISRDLFQYYGIPAE